MWARVIKETNIDGRNFFLGATGNKALGSVIFLL